MEDLPLYTAMGIASVGAIYTFFQATKPRPKHVNIEISYEPLPFVYNQGAWDRVPLLGSLQSVGAASYPMNHPIKIKGVPRMVGRDFSISLDEGVVESYFYTPEHLNDKIIEAAEKDVEVIVGGYYHVFDTQTNAGFLTPTYMKGNVSGTDIDFSLFPAPQ
ncbi:MAG: hypothetical protein AABX51_08430 [Nanoarchaeota archaeon]